LPALLAFYAPFPDDGFFIRSPTMQDSSVTQPPEQDLRTLAILLWVGTIFFSFIPALVLYLTRKDDRFLLSHSTEALNWSITVLIGYAIAFVLLIILIGVLVFQLVWLINLVFCIMGAAAASRGTPYALPFCLRFIR
jgi:uncharacterized Tic20 family protein